MAADKVTLSAMFGTYPATSALKNKQLKSDLVDFDFAEVKVANNFFKSVVRDAKFDVSELAIVTFLQAKAFGKPYTLLLSFHFSSDCNFSSRSARVNSRCCRGQGCTKGWPPRSRSAKCPIASA